MFAGLRSRWMMPFWCACSTASQICVKSVRRSFSGQLTPRDVVVQRTAAHQLHREVRLDAVTRLGDARVVDLRDARVLQAAEDLGFVLEAAQMRRAGQPGTNHLQRDAAMGPILLRLVDDAHRAFADDAEDAIRADSLGKIAAGRAGQVRGPRLDRVFSLG